MRNTILVITVVAIALLPISSLIAVTIIEDFDDGIASDAWGWGVGRVGI